MGRTYFASIACVVFLFCSFSSFATHLRGGEITVVKISGLKYRISLTGYTDPTSPVKMGGGTLTFGDGSSLTTDFIADPPITTSQAVNIYTFQVEHTYAGAGNYTVSYSEQNYDEGILNVSSSVNTPFFIKSAFVIDDLMAPYSPISFSSEPIMAFETENIYSFSTAVTNDSDDIFSYQLIAPDGVADYVFPENLRINSQTGMVTWDTKFNASYTPGAYLIGISVTQFDKDKTFLGYVQRVFQLDLTARAPRITISNSISDPNGKVNLLSGTKKIKVILSDNVTTDSLQWKAYYNQSKLANNVSFTEYDSSTALAKVKVGVLQFTTDNSIVQDLPYTIVLRGAPFTSWHEQQTTFQKDISFSFFTKDTDWPIVTAVSRSDDQGISAYPNPCTNELRFTGLTEGSKVILSDQFGNKAQLFITDNEGKIDISQLPNGFYVASLAGDNRRIKIIKK